MLSGMIVDHRVDGGEVVVTGRGCRRELSGLVVVCYVELGPAACILASALTTVRLEEGVDLLAMVRVDAVTPAFVTQVRVVSPLLRAGATGKDRGLVDGACFLVDELCLTDGLLEALAVLDTWMLVISLSDIALVLLHQL